jgi:hypothetical protein
MLFGIDSYSSVVVVVVGTVSGALMTIHLFSWRSSRKRLKRLEFEIEEMRLEMRKLRNEISLLKELQNTKTAEATNCIPKIHINQLTAASTSSSNSSPSSTSSDYVDAVEDW